MFKCLNNSAEKKKLKILMAKQSKSLSKSLESLGKPGKVQPGSSGDGLELNFLCLGLEKSSLDPLGMVWD